MAAQWWAVVVGVVGTVLGWRDPAVRPRLQRLLLAFGIAYGLDAALTLTAGVVTEARGQLWTWLFAVLPVALLLIKRGPPAGVPIRPGLPVDRVATVLLAVLALGGVPRGAPTSVSTRPRARRLPPPPAAATAHDPEKAAPTAYQDLAVRNTRSGRIMASTMFMAVRQEQGGVLPRWQGVECRELAERAASGPVIRLGPIGALANVVGVIVPTPPSWI